ncbi:MAG: hypothetical protein KKB59_03580, partial [Spirochaetes bacterium]|nr:hypothetical protein [Spirochaetota bacterium]
IAIRVESETLPTGDARSAWKVIDPLKGAILAEGVIEGQEPTARDLAEFWWLPLVAAAEDAAGAAGPLGRAPWVRVEAAPGTRISGLSAAGDAIGSRAEGSGSAVAVVPESGFLALGLRVPGTYEWRAEAAGAYPESGTFFAAEPGATLSVPRRPLRRWMLEAGLFMAQYPDLWAAWRFAEDRFFLRLGLGQFMAGLYLVDEEYGTETPSAFSSLPLVQPGAGLGWYAMPPDSPVRPYALASASARVSVATETGLAIDPVAPWIVAAAIGAEWPIARAWSLFLEIGAAFYPLCDGALLASSRGYSGIGSPIYGDGWLLEAPTMRFGARVSF